MNAPVHQRYRLLVVDGDRASAAALERVALKAGFDVDNCADGAAALDMALRRSSHLVFLDLQRQAGGGLELLRRFRRTVPRCAVVVTTAAGSLEEAVEAIKAGARDYLTKPFNPARIEALFAEIRKELERSTAGISALVPPLPQELGTLIGRSPAMLGVLASLRQLAPHSRFVLITGETGTGKDLAAQACHQLGPRRQRPLVRVHGSAFDDRALIDAAGATLCLDEVGDLDAFSQARLLRAIDEDALRRRSRPLDTLKDLSIISTSRRDLRAAGAAGAFRDDLFYRLSVVEIAMPPLRARREDIPLLAAAAIRDMAMRLQRPLMGMTRPAERILVGAPWPGNVRELLNVVERACLASSGPLLSEQEVLAAMSPPPLTAPLDQSDATPGSADTERERIVAVLQHVRGNRLAAAKVLGISRRALYRRLERYRIGAEAPPRRAYPPRAR